MSHDGEHDDEFKECTETLTVLPEAGVPKEDGTSVCDVAPGSVILLETEITESKSAADDVKNIDLLDGDACKSQDNSEDENKVGASTVADVAESVSTNVNDIVDNSDDDKPASESGLNITSQMQKVGLDDGSDGECGHLEARDRPSSDEEESVNIDGVEGEFISEEEYAVSQPLIILSGRPPDVNTPSLSSYLDSSSTNDVVIGDVEDYVFKKSVSPDKTIEKSDSEKLSVDDATEDEPTTEVDENEDVDDDEDSKNPAFVPKKGQFYCHDLRVMDEGSDKLAPRISQKEMWMEKQSKWSHDMFMANEQAPRSEGELVNKYGYDIREDEHAPLNPEGRHFNKVRRQPVRSDTESSRQSTFGRRTQKPFNLNNDFPALQSDSQEGKIDSKQNEVRPKATKATQDNGFAPRSNPKSYFGQNRDDGVQRGSKEDRPWPAPPSDGRPTRGGFGGDGGDEQRGRSRGGFSSRRGDHLQSQRANSGFPPDSSREQPSGGFHRGGERRGGGNGFGGGNRGGGAFSNRDDDGEQSGYNNHRGGFGSIKPNRSAFQTGEGENYSQQRSDGGFSRRGGGFNRGQDKSGFSGRQFDEHHGDGRIGYSRFGQNLNGEESGGQNQGRRGGGFGQQNRDRNFGQDEEQGHRSFGFRGRGGQNHDDQQYTRGFNRRFGGDQRNTNRLSGEWSSRGSGGDDQYGQRSHDAEFPAYNNRSNRYNNRAESHEFQSRPPYKQYGDRPPRFSDSRLNAGSSTGGRHNDDSGTNARYTERRSFYRSDLTRNDAPSNFTPDSENYGSNNRDNNQFPLRRGGSSRGRGSSRGDYQNTSNVQSNKSDRSHDSMEKLMHPSSHGQNSSSKRDRVGRTAAPESISTLNDSFSDTGPIAHSSSYEDDDFVKPHTGPYLQQHKQRRGGASSTNDATRSQGGPPKRYSAMRQGQKERHHTPEYNQQQQHVNVVNEVQQQHMPSQHLNVGNGNNSGSMVTPQQQQHLPVNYYNAEVVTNNDYGGNNMHQYQSLPPQLMFEQLMAAGVGGTPPIQSTNNDHSSYSLPHGVGVPPVVSATSPPGYNETNYMSGVASQLAPHFSPQALANFSPVIMHALASGQITEMDLAVAASNLGGGTVFYDTGSQLSNQQVNAAAMFQQQQQQQHQQQQQQQLQQPKQQTRQRNIIPILPPVNGGGDARQVYRNNMHPNDVGESPPPPEEPTAH